VAGGAHQLDTEAAPLRYVGGDADSERAIRWLIVLMVLTCDPLAIALTVGRGDPSLKPIWSVTPSIPAVPTGSRGTVAVGQEETPALQKKCTKVLCL
jgi:hypothetical protein